MHIKKSTITIISIILVLTIGFGAAAAVYILQQVNVTLFNGHLGVVENGQVIDSPQPEDKQPELVVKVDGVKAGHDSVLTQGDDIIPILTDVESIIDANGCYAWQSRSGHGAFAAKDFVLTAEGGDMSGLAYDLIVEGNPSIVDALRFGFILEYNDAESGKITEFFTSSADGSVALPEILGDGIITEGEEIKVSVSIWADAYTLADKENYDNMSFSVDVIFSAGS